MLPLGSKSKSLISGAALLLALSSSSAWAGGHTSHGEELVLPEMTQEQLDGVRATIKKFANYSDDEVRRMMAILDNESGMLSAPETTGEIGLLVLAHGFHGEGFTQFTDAFAGIRIWHHR